MPRNVVGTRQQQRGNKSWNMSIPIVSRTEVPGGSVSGAYMECLTCGSTKKLLRCSRCKSAAYCTKEHQKLDWKRHKEFCIPNAVNASVNPSTGLVTSNKRLVKSNKCTYGSGVGILSNLNSNAVGEISRIQSSNDDLQRTEERNRT